MRWLISSLQFCALVGLAYLYLYPGSEALLNQRTDTVMSDGTDPAPLPYSYDQMLKTWREHPSRFFYGTVYVDGGDPERGIAQWVPWSERWIVVLSSYFFPLEQLSTAYVFVLMILNAMCMYGLARYLKWSRSIASGLALAWAFCAYTRARAKVHGAMVGTYHLPLIFLALLLVARGRGWRSLLAAMACLTLAATTTHYYIVTVLFLSPLFLLFVAIQPEAKANWRRLSLRTAAAVLPAVLFLGLNYLKTIPADVKMKASESFPKSGEMESGVTHPFLYYFAAHPIDYFGSDISLNAGTEDPNPLRNAVNQKILHSLDGGNAHERTNGVRWVILILAAAASVFLAMGRFNADKFTHNNLLFFFAFAGFTFWLSLSPDSPFPGWGPSGWLQALVHQVRVPSRAGINVHFALLMVAGIFLASHVRWRKLLLYPAVFPALMIAGYPPLTQNMPMSVMRPAYSELQREHGPCGAGMYFPFINFYSQNLAFYTFLQRMRGSDCAILNSMSTPARLIYLTQNFPPDLEYLHRLSLDSRSADLLEKLARCMPLTWLAFDAGVPAEWRTQMCQRLGWKQNQDLTCVSPNQGAPLQRYPDECP